MRNIFFIDNTLYKKDKDYENNKVKYRVPYETERFNLVKKVHIDNGHLCSNRTHDKIIELGYKWENMINYKLDCIKYECIVFLPTARIEPATSRSSV